MKKWILSLTALAVVLTLNSCATRGVIVQRDRVVEEMGQKGSWIHKEWFQKGDYIYFRGVVENVYDLPLGRRQAEADAKKRIAESITSLVETEFAHNTYGPNMSPGDVGRFTQDAIAWTAENVRLAEVFPVKSYWQKVERIAYGRAEYLYNCYSLVRMPKATYLRARERAILGMIEEARREKNKKAEEFGLNLLKNLKDKEKRGEIF
jgi:hypothetical protein